MTLAEGRRARANLRRAGCKALPWCAAACGEEEEARKKQAELRHRGEGELGPGLPGAGPLGCRDSTQAGARGKVGTWVLQPNFGGIGVVMPRGAQAGAKAGVAESASPPAPGLILQPSGSQRSPKGSGDGVGWGAHVVLSRGEAAPAPTFLLLSCRWTCSLGFLLTIAPLTAK